MPLSGPIQVSQFFAPGSTVNAYLNRSDDVPLGTPIATTSVSSRGTVEFDLPEGNYIAAQDGINVRVRFTVHKAAGIVTTQDVTAAFSAPYRQATVAVESLADMLVADVRPNRVLLELKNTHATIGIWIAFGVAATPGALGWYLSPGETYRSNYLGSLSARADSGAPVLCVLEW